MKTIEQAATNAYSVEVLSSGCNAGVTFGKEMFKQGVEFATKWYSFKDHRPPYYTTCLVKLHEKTEPISAWLANTGDSDVWTICSTNIILPSIKLWRPVSFL